MQYIIMFLIIVGLSLSDILTGWIKAHVASDYHSGPIFSSFSFSGIGADFKTASGTSAVSLPEEICFRFQKPNTLSFQFPKKQEVIL